MDGVNRIMEEEVEDGNGFELLLDHVMYVNITKFVGSDCLQNCNYVSRSSVPLDVTLNSNLSFRDLQVVNLNDLPFLVELRFDDDDDDYHSHTSSRCC
jgi:hypothetical protein